MAEEVTEILKLRDEIIKLFNRKVSWKPLKGLSSRDRKKAKREVKEFNEKGELPRLKEWEETFGLPEKDLPKPSKRRIERDINKYLKGLKREAREKGRLKRPDKAAKLDEV